MTKAELMKKIRQLAFGPSNDAVRLLFVDGDDPEAVAALDLSLVENIKRGAGGALEIKLTSRVELLKLLSQLVQAEDAAPSGAEAFFRAMDRAAESLREPGDGDQI